jgi:dimethylamine/trimethylamine dehydrogenase
VSLAEASRTLGGRVVREATLPGLSAWIRVVDYREQQLRRLDGVEVFLQSEMTSDDVIENDFNHVVTATGAAWRHDGVGRWHTRPMDIAEGAEVLNPDDVMSGSRPRGNRVVVFDDDHYYLGGVIAELLAGEGHDVSLVTPAAHVSQWTTNTLEVARIRKRIIRAGVHVHTNTAVTAVTSDGVRTACVFTGDQGALAADSVVMVTARLPHDALYQELMARQSEWAGADLRSVRAIGDAWAPATIAAAVWSGHRYAEELDEPQAPGPVPYLREVAELASPSVIHLPITPIEPVPT